MEAPNAGEVGKNCIFRPVEKPCADTLPPKMCVCPPPCHGGPRRRRCAIAGICCVINSVGCGRSMFITPTLHVFDTEHRMLAVR